MLLTLSLLQLLKSNRFIALRSGTDVINYRYTACIKLSEILNAPAEELLDLKKDYYDIYIKTQLSNLSRYRKEAGLSQEEVANKLNVTKSAVSQWESGKLVPSEVTLNKLSKIYNVPVSSLFSTDDLTPPWQEINEIPTSETPEFTNNAFEVPLVATLRCGYNSAGSAFYDILQRIELPPSYKHKYGSDIVMVKAVGESMLPTIRPRDMLICKPGDAWEDGQIVIINVDDNDTIKRIYHSKDKGIDLVPDNSAFRTLHLSPEELKNYPPHVLGRIVRNMGQDL